MPDRDTLLSMEGYKDLAVWTTASPQPAFVLRIEPRYACLARWGGFNRAYGL